MVIARCLDIDSSIFSGAYVGRPALEAFSRKAEPRVQQTYLDILCMDGDGMALHGPT